MTDCSNVVRSILVESAPRRAHMQRIIRIGQHWRRRSDGCLMRVYQVHRADRLVELHREGGTLRYMVTFDELRRRYELERDG